MGMKQTSTSSWTAYSALQGGTSGFPSWGDLLLLLLLFFLSSLLGATVALLAGCPFPQWVDGVQHYPEAWGETLFWVYAVQMAFMLGGTWLYRRLRGGRGRVVELAPRGLSPLFLGWGILLLLSTSVVLSPLLELFPDQSDPGSGSWALCAVVVLAPFCEEVLCRGMLLQSLRQRYGVVIAWLLSSLFFGVIHLQPVQVINALIMGLILGFFALSARSLWPAILLHAFNNALALLFRWTEFPGEKFDGRSIAELRLGEMLSDPVAYGVVYILCLLIFLVSALFIGRKMVGWWAEEKKNRSENEINPPADTLNSGKKA